MWRNTPEYALEKKLPKAPVTISVVSGQRWGRRQIVAFLVRTWASRASKNTFPPLYSFRQERMITSKAVREAWVLGLGGGGIWAGVSQLHFLLPPDFSARDLIARTISHSSPLVSSDQRALLQRPEAAERRCSRPAPSVDPDTRRWLLSSAPARAGRPTWGLFVATRDISAQPYESRLARFHTQPKCTAKAADFCKFSRKRSGLSYDALKPLQIPLQKVSWREPWRQQSDMSA